MSIKLSDNESLIYPLQLGNSERFSDKIKENHCSHFPDKSEIINKLNKEKRFLIAHPNIDEKITELYDSKRTAQVFAEERGDIIRMRKIWSIWLLITIIGIVIFDAFLIILIGLKILAFDNKYIIPVVITESLFKIIGLAYLVVKFLFDRKSVRSI